MPILLPQPLACGDRRCGPRPDHSSSHRSVSGWECRECDLRLRGGGGATLPALRPESACGSADALVPTSVPVTLPWPAGSECAGRPWAVTSLPPPTPRVQVSGSASLKLTEKGRRPSLPPHAPAPGRPGPPRRDRPGVRLPSSRRGGPRAPAPAETPSAGLGLGLERGWAPGPSEPPGPAKASPAARLCPALPSPALRPRG